MIDVPGFIDALGGTAKTAKLFGVSMAAVSNWRKSRELPARLHLRAVRVANEHGIAFDPERENFPVQRKPEIRSVRKRTREQAA